MGWAGAPTSVHRRLPIWFPACWSMRGVCDPALRKFLLCCQGSAHRARDPFNPASCRPPLASQLLPDPVPWNCTASERVCQPAFQPASHNIYKKDAWWLFLVLWGWAIVGSFCWKKCGPAAFWKAPMQNCLINAASHEPWLHSPPLPNCGNVALSNRGGFAALQLAAAAAIDCLIYIGDRGPAAIQLCEPS